MHPKLVVLLLAGVRFLVQYRPQNCQTPGMVAFFVHTAVHFCSNRTSHEELLVDHTEHQDRIIPVNFSMNKRYAGGNCENNNERLTRRVTFGTMAGGENPGPGGQEKNWAQCLADDLRVFQATEGSTGSPPLLFGIETVLWPRAAQKNGKWYRGVAEAANCFIARWYKDKA